MTPVTRRALRGWVVLAIIAAATPIQAQVLPSSPDDSLVLPPELRPAAPSVPVQAVPARPPGHKPTLRVHPASHQDAGPAPHPRTDPDHPVDVGVTLRGGSGTTRVYGQTGTSEAIQETGSAFGAGMKFGF